MQNEILASSKTVPLQLFKYKNNAYGIQFHLELEKDTILKWLNDKIYKKKFEENFSESGIDEILNHQKYKIKKLNSFCKLFF